MALESVPPAETLVQSNITEDDDLEDGEIPSDEDDEPTPPPKPKSPEPQRPSAKSDSKDKSNDSKSSSKSSSKTTSNNNNKSSSNSSSNKNDRVAKYKNPSDDWAGDVEKAIKAALDKDKEKDDKSKSKGSSSSRRKDRKRSRDEKDDDRNKDQKKRRMSDDENGNEDDEEFMFVRGASPTNPREHRDSRESSPRRRSHESDNFDGRDSDRDSEERLRHRGGDDRRNRGSTPRRSSKNDRSSKSKNRNSARNDRSGRRHQGNDHNQDPDSICVYFMQGKCHRGDDCPFSHNALPPRKMELCKFYLMDCCAKRDKCLYMHHDFPCKFYHTGLKCQAGSNCKFSHDPLSDQVKNILLKHLETAPKEILGDFPRLSRESALMMINNTQRSHAQGTDPTTQKIPSLFDVTLPTPPNQPQNDKDEDSSDHQKRSKDKKGKKSRWGSDDDRVPLEQIVLLQSVSQLGLNMPNVAALSLAVQQQLQQRLLLQQCIANMEFYKDIQGNDSKAKDSEKSDDKSPKPETAVKNPKDVDLRQLLPNSAQKPAIDSLADAAANSTKSSKEEESDREEEPNLVIEVPQEEEEKNKEEEKKNTMETSENDNAVPNLPKTAQELFLRIQQQQQQKAESEQKTIQNVLKGQEAWYSDDSDNDNDDDEEGPLQIVIKDNPRDENSEKSDQESPTKEPPAPIIPQPAPFVELGNYNKIDISAEVTKLLSAIKPQAKRNIEESSKEIAEKARSKSPEESSKVEAAMSPKPVSRDPRMSRDPRQRRLEEAKPSSPSTSDGRRDSSRPLRLETSIYSSGITDYGADTDLRARLDQDHRVKDLDLRQRYQDFGDTDLRINTYEGKTRSDVDLRQMLTLPFKPAPSHVPCTEIDASYASHPAKPYKVYVVDIPRPNYSGLKLTRDDAAVKHDPRLRKIFNISLDDTPESPMSPPPAPVPPAPVNNIPDTPRSPPPMRADPRRKALEPQIPVNPVNPDIQMNMGGPMIPGVNMAMNPMINGPLQGQMPMGMNAAGPSQMAYGDPRYIQRNGGPGLLGPAPGLGYPEANYEPGYSGNNYNNFGPNEPMMGYNNNQMGYGNNGGDWSPGNQNPARNRGRLRRRNRNRTNPGGGRSNRSPQ